MAFDALRQETFTTALTPTRKGGASAFRPHARAETVLALASSF
jgi:hypothetical protein